VLQQGVRSITDLMVMPGLINLDFADVRSVMGEMGKAMMGTGEGDGPNRALEAAERAIANPLLDGVSMQGAAGVIISIIGGDDMKLLEVDEAANHIRELVDPNANIIWGSAFNPISMARSACRSWPPVSSRAPKWPNRSRARSTFPAPRAVRRSRRRPRRRARTRAARAAGPSPFLPGRRPWRRPPRNRKPSTSRSISARNMPRPCRRRRRQATTNSCSAGPRKSVLPAFRWRGIRRPGRTRHPARGAGWRWQHAVRTHGQSFAWQRQGGR
jgi:cell division protein FtsZ